MDARRIGFTLPTLSALALLTVLAGCGQSVSPRDGEAGDVAQIPDEIVVPIDAFRDGPSTTDGPPGVDRPAPPDVPIVPGGPGLVDLLVVVDNSNSMRENQQQLLSKLRQLTEMLVRPPDADGNGVPDYPATTDLHVGVVSTDLGTPGSAVPGCANSDLGDDGLLNPIRNGQAMARHEPWISAPIGFRPADCNRPDQFPSFITFNSGVTDAALFAHDFQCNVALYVNGCGLEQSLESAYRALVWHNASDRPGNMDPNAGFLRDAAVLAIVVLTDEEDGSARDCRFAEPGIPCTEATDAFATGSTRWASPNLNMRFYMYQPASSQDPTWPLERYVDPRNPLRGFLGLKPGHPERVVFAALTGVPLTLAARTDGTTDWDRLLGAPDPSNRDNFSGRNSSTAISLSNEPGEMSGPISMRQANQDPDCAERTVPSCRRQGSSFDPARPPCNPTEQYFAWPARRVVEIARRMDESAICAGRPCRNGVVRSICAVDYTRAVNDFARVIGSRVSR